MKFLKIKFVIVSFVLSFLIGCSNSNMENVVSEDISFELLKYFDGETKAWGIVVDRFGNLQRTFKVKLIGKTNDNQLLLKEYLKNYNFFLFFSLFYLFYRFLNLFLL